MCEIRADRQLPLATIAIDNNCQAKMPMEKLVDETGQLLNENPPVVWADMPLGDSCDMLLRSSALRLQLPSPQILQRRC